MSQNVFPARLEGVCYKDWGKGPVDTFSHGWPLNADAWDGQMLFLAQHGFSYVLDGELAHKDSLGTGSVIRPGDVQRMSAGRGVTHSEFNPSREKPVHFLQIWIQSDRRGVAPSYEQKRFEPEEKRGRLQLIASPDGVDNSVRIHQDAKVYAGLFDGSEQATFPIGPDRQVYLHVARGSVTANDTVLNAGDAVALTDAPTLSLARGSDAEVLVFDLPKVGGKQ